MEEGYHLYVTTTTPEGPQLRAERRKTEQLTKRYNGSVALLEPQYDKVFDTPTSEWIANSYEQYFGYIAEYRDIKTIIGMLPGTTKTAVELKEIFKCKLVFLATNIVEGLSNADVIKEELIRIAEETNEIWCVGHEVYAYYQDMLHVLNIKCQNIMLQPSKKQANTFKPQAQVAKFLSVWNNPHPFYYMGRRAYSAGSRLQNFCILSAALRKINLSGPHRRNVQRNIHGLRFQDKKTIESHALFTVSSLSTVSSVEKFTWPNCQAYIDPDIDGKNVNCLALKTLWLGVPTIVSKTSATGKFLQQIPCADRALVTLSGDTATDIEIWRQKISKDILNEYAKPFLWANEISEYLHNTAKLWEIDLSVLRSNKRRLSGGSISSYITAREQPHPDVVAKVEPWLQSTKVKDQSKTN